MAKVKVTPIMGPGCGIKELEHCPPSYHVELTPEQMCRAIQNPNYLTTDLGLPPGITDIQVHTEGVKGENVKIYCCIKCTEHGLCCRAWAV